MTALSERAMAWLTLATALVIFAGGFSLRAYVGRVAETDSIRRVTARMRFSTIGRFLYGPVAGPRDTLDSDDLDQVFLMPTIIFGAGFTLIGVFLLGLILVRASG